MSKTSEGLTIQMGMSKLPEGFSIVMDSDTPTLFIVDRYLLAIAEFSLDELGWVKLSHKVLLKPEDVRFVSEEKILDRTDGILPSLEEFQSFLD